MRRSIHPSEKERRWRRLQRQLPFIIFASIFAIAFAIILYINLNDGPANQGSPGQTISGRNMTGKAQ